MIDLTPEEPRDDLRDLREMEASRGYRLFHNRMLSMGHQIDQKLRLADEHHTLYRLQGERRAVETVIKLVDAMMAEVMRERAKR